MDIKYDYRCRDYGDDGNINDGVGWAVVCVGAATGVWNNYKLIVFVFIIVFVWGGSAIFFPNRIDSLVSS